MKTQFFILFLLFSIVANSHAQQQWVSGGNPEWLIMYDGQQASQYPSEATISGAYPYLVGLEVHFPYLYNDGNFDGFDIMLESPGGQRVMLMSDLDFADFTYQHPDAGISSFSNKPLTPGQFSAFTLYLPGNFGAEPDIFPAPGPGLVAPATPTLAALVNENPNGVWKLWIVDDALDGNYFSLDNGWSLSVLSSAVPVCAQPELPVVSDITDSTALISWAGNDPASHWDILFGSDNLPDPDADTSPTISGWTSNSLLLENLPPDENVKVYVRSACDDGGRSFWMGPLTFKTLFTPCLHAKPLTLCQSVSCDSVHHFSDFNVQTNCFGQWPGWVFRFTVPETGPYWLNYETYNSGFYSIAYWMPDTSAACPHTGWHCLEQGSGAPFSRILDTLTGGMSYFLMFENSLEPPEFQLCPCPEVNLILEQTFDTKLEPFTASVHFAGIPNNQPSTFDLFYTANPNLVPGPNTPPTESGIVVNPPVDKFIYHLAADTLTPSTTYKIWARSPCAAGGAHSGWQGPFEFQTGTFCGAFESVWFDSITDHSARLTFRAPSYSIITTELWTAPHAVKVGGPPQIFADSAGQVFSRVLNGLQPETDYEIYFKAFCWPAGGDNPWYGPFTFKTQPGCFLPLRDIDCGETVFAGHFQRNSPSVFQSNPCVTLNGSYTSVNEALFRITALKTGNMVVGRIDNGVDPSNQFHWFYKEDLLGCNSAGFSSAGCMFYPNNSVSIPVDSGHTYYLLVDGLMYQGNSEEDMMFRTYGCAPKKCPTVDSFWLDAKTATTVKLRWKNVSPGATYQIKYNPVNLDLVKIATTTDTIITLTGLLPDAFYDFVILTKCPGGEVADSWNFHFQLGDHEVIHESVLSRCSPRFVPPGFSTAVNYDEFELKAPFKGDYHLVSFWENTHLYIGNFDPANPSSNLLASVTEVDTNFRKDLTVSLSPGKTYHWVVSADKQYPFSPYFNYGGTKNLQILVDGPVEAQIGPAKWNGVEPGPHGLISYAGGWADGTCADTAGWVHYYKRADNTNNIGGDALMLSLKTSVDADLLSKLPMTLVNDPGASKITNPPAPFVQNPDGWYEMNRFWLMQDLQPSQQIDSIFNVRFYYTQQNFEDMKSAIEGGGGMLDSHEGMYFHKINGYHDYQNIAPWFGHIGIPGAVAYDSTGYWQYANGPEATTTTWRHGTFAGEHYAEMVIRGFSGGGGGASVNGKSVFDPVSKTTAAETKGQVLVWPNPNTGMFMVELPRPASSDMLFRITDLTGRSVLEQVAETGASRQRVRAGTLPAGFYFLQALSGGKIWAVERFVKE